MHLGFRSIGKGLNPGFRRNNGAPYELFSTFRDIFSGRAFNSPADGDKF